MFAVTYKYKDIEDTATMSDDTEIKAVFHAGIALGLQYLENSDAGLMLELVAPGTISKVLLDLDRFVRDGQITAKRI